MKLLVQRPRGMFQKGHVVPCGWRDRCAMVGLVFGSHVGFCNWDLTVFKLLLSLKLEELLKCLGPLLQVEIGTDWYGLFFLGISERQEISNDTYFWHSCFHHS